MEVARTARISFGLVVATLVLAACAVTPQKPYLPSADEKRLLDLISVANPPAKFTRMSGRVSIRSDKGDVRSNGTVAIEPPNNMRVVLSDSFGITWFLLVVKEKTVFYSSPKEGKIEESAREPGVPVRLGRLAVVPEDVVAHIRPSFQPDAFDGAALFFKKNGLMARWADRSLDLEIDPQYRITYALVKRANGGEIKFKYAYSQGNLMVDVNSEVVFDFNRVETLDEAPSGLFLPPSL